MTQPELWIQIRTGEVRQEPFLVEHGPATFGWDPACDIVLRTDANSSRHMGTLVPDGTGWWLVNPVHAPDEGLKRPIHVTAKAGRWRSDVDEGGAIQLNPGSAGTIRPYSTSGIELVWHVVGDPAPALVDAVRWGNESLPSTRVEDGAAGVHPNDVVIRRQTTSLEELEELEDELTYLYQQVEMTNGIKSASAPQLPDAVLDYLVTSSWLVWHDLPGARFLTGAEVSRLWELAGRTYNASTPERTIRRGLAAYNEVLFSADPISWDDRKHALDELRRTGTLRQSHFDWQDLAISYPEELPTPRPDGTCGPRYQQARQPGSTKAR
jgi:hypothetical protein